MNLKAFSVRFVGANALMSVDVTVNVRSADFSRAETRAWEVILNTVPPVEGAPTLEITEIRRVEA